LTQVDICILHLHFIIEQGHRVNWVTGSTGSTGSPSQLGLRVNGVTGSTGSLGQQGHRVNGVTGSTGSPGQLGHWVNRVTGSTGSLGQLGLRVAGFPGHWVARWVTKRDRVPSVVREQVACSLPPNMAAVMVLFSRGGAHLDSIATNAGNAMPCTHTHTTPSRPVTHQ